MNTTLHESPFYLLGVSLRDNRHSIVVNAEDKSLEKNPDQCQAASSVLTAPRSRLSAEVAWLPGVSPSRAQQIIELVESDPLTVVDEDGIPAVAHCNALCSGLGLLHPNTSNEDLADYVCRFALVVENISSEEVRRDINEDRLISGFPEVSIIDQIEEEISNRKRVYRNSIKGVLDKLEPSRIVDVMTLIAEESTSYGSHHAPELIDDLVDSYEVEIQGVLEQEALNVTKLIELCRASAPQGERALAQHMQKLEKVVRNWDWFAQPIQLSAMARGITHDRSRVLAYEIRSLAIDLFNTHDLIRSSQQITNWLQELFSEVPEIMERVGQDAEALDDISSARNERAERFKDFNLSGNVFSWKNNTYDIATIKHIGFYRALTTHKTNFVETGKTERAHLTLTFDNGQAVKISIDEQGFLWNKSLTKQIQTLAEFYGYLLHVTFDKRLKYYEDQLARNGYWIYDECYFYPRKKIVFRGKEFDMSATSLMKGYGYVELRKKDYGFLDKLKREVSITKIPQFNTLTDTDVIFQMLEKHMGLKWGN